MRLALLVTFAALCFGFQESDEEQRLPGQPETCNNFRGMSHPCRCARAMMRCAMPGDHANPDAGPNKCLTTCRPKSCKCSGPGCASRR